LNEGGPAKSNDAFQSLVSASPTALNFSVAVLFAINGTSGKYSAFQNIFYYQFFKRIGQIAGLVAL